MTTPQRRGTGSTGGSAQKRAASVCAAVRVVLVFAAIRFTSLMSRAHRELWSGGGPPP